VIYSVVLLLGEADDSDKDGLYVTESTLHRYIVSCGLKKQEMVAFSRLVPHGVHTVARPHNRMALVFFY